MENAPFHLGLPVEHAADGQDEVRRLADGAEEQLGADVAALDVHDLPVAQVLQESEAQPVPTEAVMHVAKGDRVAVPIG